MRLSSGSLTVVRKMLNPNLVIVVIGGRGGINRNTKGTFNTNWTKSILGLNILLENPSFALDMTSRFQASSLKFVLLPKMKPILVIRV